MYEQNFPEIDEVVMVQVKSIAEMGAYVQLLEYDNIEGMILLSELTRRRIRSVSKLIKVGRIEPVMVLRVDKEKGYIDLSKRRVSPEDVRACEEKYNKSKMVHSILRHVAETTPSQSLVDLYECLGWPLYQIYGHAFEAFRLMVTDPESVFERVQLSGLTDDAVEEYVKTALLKDIRRRMTPQPLKIRADVELTCFEYDGVEHIRNALKSAENVTQDGCDVKVSLVASPLYVFTTQTADKEVGIQAIATAISSASDSIVHANGIINVKEHARVVSEKEDRLLAEKIEKIASEVTNESDSEDDTMGAADV
ncbi:eukaryotic translation initiation factor 2 alpha subunit-domain-containing protein [Ostreococcus tauri]|uniref:Eukaryotic translation initiation factor 2 alpha subunit-domain-containing protein n=1 Tax=Ostreococcus tauri TaxID=70448 RepID=A0A1Y5I461_OSTTA|nr:eukaryotic translation initiation factor 2 alpha subunit-domain-containing protein [Ostreococcus tauri]